MKVSNLRRINLQLTFLIKKSDSQASQTNTQKEISVSGKSKESVVSATSGVCSSNQSGSKATATPKDTLSEMNENKLSGASVQTPSNMSIETGTEEMDVQPVVFSDLVWRRWSSGECARLPCERQWDRIPPVTYSSDTGFSPPKVTCYPTVQGTWLQAVKDIVRLIWFSRE